MLCSDKKNEMADLKKMSDGITQDCRHFELPVPSFETLDQMTGEIDYETVCWNFLLGCMTFLHVSFVSRYSSSFLHWFFSLSVFSSSCTFSFIQCPYPFLILFAFLSSVYPQTMWKMYTDFATAHDNYLSQGWVSQGMRARLNEFEDWIAKWVRDIKPHKEKAYHCVVDVISKRTMMLRGTIPSLRLIMGDLFQKEHWQSLFDKVCQLLDGFLIINFVS